MFKLIGKCNVCGKTAENHPMKLYIQTSLVITGVLLECRDNDNELLKKTDVMAVL